MTVYLERTIPRPPRRVASTYFSNEVRYRPEGHPAQTQFTPEYVLGPVRAALGGSIELDPCTTPDNPCGAERFYCPPQDGAVLPWDASTIFVNSPYGKARERWVDRCLQAAVDGSAVILLMPSATDTRTWQRATASADAVLFTKGRLRFGTLRPNRRQVAASHPSCLLGWNVDLTPCAHLGLLVDLNMPIPRGRRTQDEDRGRGERAWRGVPVPSGLLPAG